MGTSGSRRLDHDPDSKGRACKATCYRLLKTTGCGALTVFFAPRQFSNMPMSVPHASRWLLTSGWPFSFGSPDECAPAVNSRPGVRVGTASWWSTLFSTNVNGDLGRMLDSKTGHLFTMSQERGQAPPPPLGRGRGPQGAVVPGSFTIANKKPHEPDRNLRRLRYTL
jgi:hypothetical protein